MWLQLAKAEKSLGNTDATLNAIEKAAQVSPDNGMMLAVLGFSYINLNRIPQAIPPLQRAAKLLPKNYLVQSARVLPDDSRPNGCGNRIFTQGRKLKFQLRPRYGSISALPIRNEGAIAMPWMR